MTRAAQRPVGRPLAVVALLLGLLAMHGLPSGHHVPGLALTPAAATAEAPEQGQHHALSTSAAELTMRAAGTFEHDEVRGGAGPVPAAAAADAGSSCHSACPDHVAASCLAVLSAGLAALAVLGARRTRALPLPALPEVALPRPGPPLRLRPPDPVRDLSISRT